MPKTIKLTWQEGVRNREGRWKKFYRGKAYYFAGGKGKSDREGYDAAWAAWEIKKAAIDLTAPRKHQRDYEAAIDQWEQVLAWSNRHGDKEHADQATAKLADLRRRFAAPKLSPLKRKDWFEANFDLPIDQNWLKELTLPKLLDFDPPDEPGVVVTLKPEHADYLDGSPQRITRELWQDRLAVMQRKAAPEDESLQAHIQKFLKQKENQANAGEVSIGRVYALKLHLLHFQDWLGKDTSVKEVDGEVLVNFHTHVLEKATSKEWTKTTSNHYMTTAKGFVRWLWQSNAIPVLPRILDGKSQMLKITRPSPKIVVFDKDEIKTLLEKASDRTTLYILLMLNCGMTQKDIADLLVTEVDWKEGRIIRKRSKTADEENVPVVNYKLWGETFRLLQQERAADSTDRVLLNFNGSAIWTEQINGEGKYQKTDNVKSAFDRLRKVVKIEKPLKSLKKTSASLLRDNANFSNLEKLFLGHAPQSMSDRYYTQVPQTLFDQAIAWLGQEFGLA